MKIKRNSIQFKIFIFYAVISIVCVLLVSAFLSYASYERLSGQAYDLLTNQAEYYSNSIDEEIKIMNNSSLSVLYNYAIREYLSGEQQHETPFNISTEEIIRGLTSSILYSDSVHQAILYSDSGEIFSSRNSTWRPFDVTTMAWYDDTINSPNNMYLTSPYYCEDETMSSEYTTVQPLISLCRVATDTYRRSKGVVEIRQYAAKVFASVSEPKDFDIVVLNDSNEVIYPYDHQVSPYFAQLDNIPAQMESNEQLFQHKASQENSDLVAAYCHSGLTDFTVILLQAKSQALFETREYIVSMAITSVVVMLLILIVSFYVSSRITKPMALLKRHVERCGDIAQYHTMEPQKPSGVLEVDELSNAFSTMSTELNNSIHNLLLAKQQEVQYKLLAIQSQMNPHFLYNSLANISAMADEGDVDQIGFMCKKLSAMLRYIGSNSREEVTVAEELEFAKAYAAALDVRFGDDLQWQFTTEQDAIQLPIPKLCIQPLLENSIKNCKGVLPPHRLSVTTRVTGTGFMVEVQDNGSGFSPQALDALQQKIKDVDENNIIPNIELDGMGLINIYIRLRLLFREHAIFTVQNLKQGCVVTIGAKEVSCEQSVL